ncbi:DUF3955 domain-containing protein [Patescibacteria group bacterium]|nr:DUF3955 domain-containing protein [Patescibacteria group bacterium]MBU2219644.1 DUF3955 domain-containing protein [Patescibacteria group bacterium]MBU2264733.1 DUF3955 domain-containing protein [Patescibacteria group bacterium]
MKKIYLVAIIPFILGISCIIAYNIIGSSVAEDGTLVEPFALLPIGWLMLAIGIVSSFILGIKFLIRKK